MKTIEEVASEYAIKQHTDDEMFAPDRFSSVADFLAGVAFAQHWKSVDEELPEVGVYVIVKDCDDSIHIARNAGNKRFCGFKTVHDIVVFEVTHWRQIELK